MAQNNKERRALHAPLPLRLWRDALSDRAGERVQMRVQGNNRGHSFIAGSSTLTEGEEANYAHTVTLDAMVSERRFGGARMHVVKIDTEGYEGPCGWR